MMYSKIIATCLLFLLAILAFADPLILMYGDYVVRSQCQPFNTISNDPVRNEKLRTELTDFVNDAKVRRRLGSFSHLKFVTRNRYAFDGSPFQWLGVFKDPSLQRDLELAVRFDDKMRHLAPTYRISEVGVYGARSLLMYKNENEAQYTGGEGAVRLSAKPSVKCQVSFSKGVPVE